MTAMTTIFLLQLSLASSALAGVVSLSISKKPPTPADLTHRDVLRRAPILEELYNNRQQGGYFTNITVGTPGQPLSLVLDTGSSDLWMLTPTTDLCSDIEVQIKLNDSCYGGTYDHTKSSTYKRLLADGFGITYVDGSTSEGDYISDDVTLSANNTIKGLQMGLSYKSTGGVGVMGLGYSTNEAAATLYPNVIDLMVTQGLINRRAYSLYLDTRSSTTGTVLFGGLDTAKFIGVLSILPLQPRRTADINSFTITMSSLSAGTVDSLASLTSSFFTLPILLDSGTTLTYLPDALVSAIVNLLGAYDDSLQSGNIWVDCALNDDHPDFVFSYQFGGSSGPRIQVPLRDVIYAIPQRYQQYFNFPWQTTCYLGILGAGAKDYYILGQSFLRSAYVVYDIDNNEVAIAQAKFDTEDEAIVEFKAGGSLPSASGVAVEVVSKTTPATSSGSKEITSSAEKPTSSTEKTASTKMSTQTVEGVTTTRNAATVTGGATASSSSAAVASVPQAQTGALMVLGSYSLCGILGGFLLI